MLICKYMSRFKKISYPHKNDVIEIKYFFPYLCDEVMYDFFCSQVRKQKPHRMVLSNSLHYHLKQNHSKGTIKTQEKKCNLSQAGCILRSAFLCVVLQLQPTANLNSLKQAILI